MIGLGGNAALTAGVSGRALRLIKAQVEDWYDVCRRLPDWEDDVLVGQAITERLAQHASLLDELDRVGRWLSSATGSPDFPDPETANLVRLTLQDLEDTRSLWHGNSLKNRCTVCLPSPPCLEYKCLGKRSRTMGRVSFYLLDAKLDIPTFQLFKSGTTLLIRLRRIEKGTFTRQLLGMLGTHVRISGGSKPSAGCAC